MHIKVSEGIVVCPARARGMSATSLPARAQQYKKMKEEKWPEGTDEVCETLFPHIPATARQRRDMGDGLVIGRPCADLLWVQYLQPAEGRGTPTLAMDPCSASAQRAAVLVPVPKKSFGTEILWQILLHSY